MTAPTDVQRDLDALDRRLKTLLPEDYQDTYETMAPAPMRSAGLKYYADGRIAWDRIWGSFCDLAMAGGPPHKGRLLEPGLRADVEAQPERYDEIAEEICRGVRMAADLDAEPSPVPGWIRVIGLREDMAGWLLRAIVMENIAARAFDRALDLPAAPHFRLDKEVKNVVTVIAKTSHYWSGHMPREQHRGIATLFASLAIDAPLLVPAVSDDGAPDARQEALAATVAQRMATSPGWPRSGHRYDGWLGIDLSDERAAIWMMRALVANNVLARRESTTLFVPVNPVDDPAGDRVVDAVTHVHALARARGVA